MSRSKPAPIAIVGGGPCGLTLARLLECDGIDYVVFERDASSVPQPGFQGGTLDIHGRTGQEALRRAGLHEEFERLARRDATSILVRRWKGDCRMKFEEKRDAPEIDRLQLRQILLDSLPSHRIYWGKTLRAIERATHPGGMGAKDIVLHFADGSTETGFRMVVGADGAWSKVRQLVSEAVRMIPSSWTLIFLRSHLPRLNTRVSCSSRDDSPSIILSTMLRARWSAPATRSPWAPTQSCACSKCPTVHTVSIWASRALNA